MADSKSAGTNIEQEYIWENFHYGLHRCTAVDMVTQLITVPFATVDLGDYAFQTFWHQKKCRLLSQNHKNLLQLLKSVKARPLITFPKQLNLM